MAAIVPKMLEASVRVQAELAQQGIEVKPASAINRLGKCPWCEVALVEWGSSTKKYCPKCPRNLLI